MYSRTSPAVKYRITVINKQSAHRCNFFGKIFLPILKPIGALVFKVASPVMGFFVNNLPITFTGDAYRLQHEKTNFILSEIYNRGSSTPDGVGVVCVGPKRIPLFSREIVFVFTDPNSVNVIADYGDDLKDAKNVDSVARTPYLPLTKLTNGNTLINLMTHEGQKERSRIKKHMTGSQPLQEAYEECCQYLNNLQTKWSTTRVLQDNISHYSASIICKCVMGIPEVDMKYIPLVRKIGDLIVRGDYFSKEFSNCRKELERINTELFTKHGKAIVGSGKYISVLLKETDPKIRHMGENASIGLIAEGNISGSLSAGLAWLNDFSDPIEGKERRAIRQRLRDEILESGWLQKKDWETLSALPFLHQVYHETLRYLSPTAIVPRKTSKDCLFEKESKEGKVHARKIPAGSYFFVPIRRIHHDPRIWKEPQKFYPSRFAESQPYFFPFSDGLRSCPAKFGFNDVMFKTTLAFIISHYDLKLEKPVSSIPLNTLNSRIEDIRVDFEPIVLESKLASEFKL